MKALALRLAAMLLRAQSSPDPADLLEQTRDKVIARLPAVGYGCIATIDRSYFRRRGLPLTPKSCEQISADSRKIHNILELAETDRLRLQMVLTGRGEVYSWPGPGGFSRNVAEVVNTGDIGTGALGGCLDGIFANPLVRFRLLEQHDKNLEFGFRVPVEASSYLVKAGPRWRATGYEGSLAIDPASQELKRVTIETDELAAETSMCETSTTLEYPAGGEGVLLPGAVRTHDLSRDTTEVGLVTTFSECGQAAEKAPEQPRRELFPPTWAVPFKLVLATPIDTATAAAGDVVTARLAEAVLGPPSSEMWAPSGAILTGRIMRIKHYLRKLDDSSPDSFLIWLDFDTIEANGSVWSIRARLVCGQEEDRTHRCPYATMSDQKWDRALTFGSDSVSNILVPAGYTSTWVTGDPPLK